MRGQTAMVYGLVIIVIFALIGMAILPTLGNATNLAAYGGTNSTNPNNMSSAATSVVWLTPMIFAAMIVLTLLTVGLGAYTAMRK